MTTETTKTESTFEIPASRLAWFETKMGELSRKASKLKVGAVGYDAPVRFEKERKVWDRLTSEWVTVTNVYYSVRVWGEAPRLNGWTLRGRLDFVSIPGATLRAMAPGCECPVELHDVDSKRCDACGSNIARNDTFLLQNEAGEWRVVGRTCIRDFLGHDSPEGIASMAEIVILLGSARDEDGEFWRSGKGSFGWPLQEVLTAAASTIRCDGWAASQEQCSTKGVVFNMVAPAAGRFAQEEADRLNARITDFDEAKAARTAAWLKGVDGTTSDYLHNLQAIGEAGVVSLKTMGLAVSAVAAYDRAMEKEVQRKMRASAPKAVGFVGSVNVREDFKGLTVSKIRTWDSQYGVTTLIRFVDSEGRVLVWKASKGQELEVGDVVSVRATVKKHETYNGEEQTVVTRAQLLEVVKPS